MTVSQILFPGLPETLAWSGPHTSTASASGDTLEITASAQTDLFCDPEGAAPTLNSPRLLFSPPAQFTLSARVTVQFRSTYDAGVLMLYANDSSWAKLCFEFSPQQQPMIVSVVTNGSSDDANAVPLAESTVFLRITGLGTAFAFHYSQDGALWHLVRYFRLQQTDGLRLGFSAQSPTGQACQALFDSIRFTNERIADIRNGE